MEQTLDLLLRHADPGILDRELDKLAVVPILKHAHLDRDLADLGELDRIAAEINEDLPEP